MEEMNLFEQAQKTGLMLQSRLSEFRDHPLVGEVRGVGLIAGLEIVKKKSPREPFNLKQGVAAHCAASCREAGLIVRNIGDVVAVCPPLIIDEDQVDELIAKLSIGLDATLDWAKKSGLMN